MGLLEPDPQLSEWRSFWNSKITKHMYGFSDYGGAGDAVSPLVLCLLQVFGDDIDLCLQALLPLLWRKV